jgi:hypothetical protein
MRGRGMKRILIVTILVLFGVSGVFAAPTPSQDYQRDRKPPEKVKEPDKRPQDNRDRDKGGKQDDKKKDERRRPY